MEWGLLFGLSIVWGGSFFFNGIAIRELPPLVIVCARMCLAATILNVVVVVSGHRLPLTRQTVPAFFGMGLLNNVIPFTLIVWGQSHITSGLAAILNATTPLFSVILAHLLTRDEKMTGRRLAGVIAGIAGVAVMVGPSFFSGIGNNGLSQLACLAAAVSYGFANVFGRRFKALGVPPLATACGQVTASSCVLIPLMLAFAQPWTLPMPGAATIGAIVGAATLSTALAYVVFFRILSTAGATNLSLVTLLVPISALLLGTVFLGEIIEPRQILGIALIALGLAAIDGRLLDWVGSAKALQSPK